MSLDAIEKVTEIEQQMRELGPMPMRRFRK